jgi:hypothetical protein
MTHSKSFTSFLRERRFTISDLELLRMMDEEFSAHGGGVRLAYALGIIQSTAYRIRAGTAEPNLFRLAYFFGYRPAEGPRGWQELPMTEEPYDPGPPMHWDDRLLAFLRQVFSNPVHRPSVKTLAWRLDTTEPRLRDAMRQYGIDLPSRGKGYGRSPVAPKTLVRARTVQDAAERLGR